MQPKELEITGQPIKKLSKEIFTCGITTLCVIKTDLLRIPAEIGLMKNLYELRVESSHLIYVSPEIGELPSLEVLSVAFNPLTKLPNTIKRLQLRTLNVTGTLLDSVPTCESMKALYADLLPHPISFDCQQIESVISLTASARVFAFQRLEMYVTLAPIEAINCAYYGYDRALLVTLV